MKPKTHPLTWCKQKSVEEFKIGFRRGLAEDSEMKFAYAGDPVRCVVNNQGAAIISHGWIQAPGETVVAIGIDMRSKRCIVSAIGSDGEAPLIVIDTNSESLHLKKGKEGELTVVTFPDFKGWSVWCADIARYTVAVCLVKRKAL